MANYQKIIRKNGTTLPILGSGPVPMFRFPSLDATEIVRHGFTTRLGGVSGTEPGNEHLTSLNLSFARGDLERNVRENYRRVSEALGVSYENFVFTDQTHTTNVLKVFDQDAGKGLTRIRDYSDIDALVTDVPGIVLSVFVADCVPVAFVDPVRRVIGLAHSGWRGTVGRIGRNTVREMTENYGSRPEDVICAIGPSICQSCYEVSSDVAEQFAREFAGHETELMVDRHDGHFLLDLWKANERVLLDAGILPEHIAVTGVCTCCNPDLLYSHRASKGMRGNLGAFLSLIPEE